MRRAGYSLLEIMVAAALFVLILGMAWQFFAAASRQGKQIGGYADLIQSLTLIQSRLEGDLASMFLPDNLNENSEVFEVGDGGRSFRFLRRRRVDSVEDLEAGAGGMYWVTWKTEPAEDGLLTLIREEDGGRRNVWKRVPMTDIRFSVQRVNFDLYTLVEGEFAGLPAEGAGGGRRSLPIRVVRRMVPPDHIYQGGSDPYPEDVLGPLPPDEEGE